MSDLIAQYTLTADGEVVVHEGASQIAAASRAATDANASTVSNADPQSSIANVEKRLAYLDGQQKPSHTGPDGKPVYHLSEVQRAKFANEAKHLREVSLPFERLNAERLVMEQAAAAASQEERLQNEAALNAEIEARAHQIAIEEQAKRLAARMAKDLHI